MRKSIICAVLVCSCEIGPPPTTSPCLELPTDSSAEVARVGTISITVEQLAQRLEEQGSGAVRRYADKKRMRQFVEDQIRFELLVRAGLERGLAEDPDVIEAARKVMVRKLLQRDLGPTVLGGEVAEEKIAAYYTEHQDEYQQPEKRRVAHIQLAPTEEGRALGENLLEKLETHTKDHNLFRLLVIKHTQDGESKKRSGELPFKSQAELNDEMGQSFAKTVFALPPGTLAPELVQSTRGWHVVKVISRREALTRSLDEVREDIRERLLKGQRAKHFDTYLAEIRQRYPVALYEERLDEVVARVTGGAEE